MKLTFEPLFEDHGIALAVMGIVVVFAALIFVSLFISLLPRGMALAARWFPEDSAASKRPTAEEELPEETVAVLAAAASVAVGSHRLVHIERVGRTGEGWGADGRRQHHASHQPPWKSPHG